MTVLYFAEKQWRRYPFKSVAYLLVCFFFAVILVLFGTVAFSLRGVEKAIAPENLLDCVWVSPSCGATAESLAAREGVDVVEYECANRYFRGELRLSSDQRLSFNDAYSWGCLSGIPQRAALVFKEEKGRSPLLYGRDILTDEEVVVNINVLRKSGVPESNIESFLGASFVYREMNFFTRAYEDWKTWTIVGITDPAFDKYVAKDYDGMNFAYVRASGITPVLDYSVYPKRGMFKTVYESLLAEYGEDSLFEYLVDGEAQQRFAQYVAFFDRVFVFLIVLLCFAFLGVTIFAVVFYTSKQSEFHAVAAAFGARRRTLMLSEILFYVVLLLVAILVSCLVSMFLQGVVLHVLSGFFEVVRGEVSVGMLFAVGGMIFGVLALCVAAGVVIGTVAVQKRNL